MGQRLFTLCGPILAAKREKSQELLSQKGPQPRCDPFRFAGVPADAPLPASSSISAHRHPDGQADGPDPGGKLLGGGKGRPPDCLAAGSPFIGVLFRFPIRRPLGPAGRPGLSGNWRPNSALVRANPLFLQGEDILRRPEMGVVAEIAAQPKGPAHIAQIQTFGERIRRF